MLCPECASKTRVLDTRSSKADGLVGIYRKRQCLSCNHTFLTIERLVASSDTSLSCGKCISDNTVVDSRVLLDGRTRRIRACNVCGFRYNTLEVLCSVNSYKAIVKAASINKEYIGNRIDNNDIIHGHLLIVKGRSYIVSKVLAISANADTVKKCTVEMIEIDPDSLNTYIPNIERISVLAK